MIAGSLEIQLLTNIARLQKDMSEARRSVGEAMASVEKSTAQAAGAMNYMIGVAKSLVGALGATQIIALADQYTKYTAQIKLATSGMTEYANAVNSVRQISKAAQTDIAATGTLFARITNGTRELGFGQARVIEITEAVTLALKVSGATAQESASAMLQLAQAFGSGVLRGEEFNAVNEAAPRLMKALADGMGQPIGALRDLATQGLITSEVMANSLPKALAELRQEAAQVQTISGAFVVLKNNLVEFVGTQAQASGAVSVLTGLIGLLAENLSLLTSAAIGFASAKIAQTITGMATATFTAVTASQAQRVATLAAAQAQAQATGTTAALTAARVAELRASVLAAEGNVALAVTTNGLVPAQARAAAAATAHAAALGTLAAAQRASSIFSAGLTGALGLLGGPIGAITLALGLGVAAWMAWGSASQSGENQAVAAIEKSTPEILEELDKQIAKLRERNALAGAGFEQLAKEGGDAASKMARLQKQIEDLTAGRGIDGSGPLPEAARLDLLQRLTMQYGQLAGAVGELRTEQEKLDSQGKRNTDVAELRNKQAGEAAKERAQEAKKAADEAKRLREEEEKFRIAWGREDSTRQGESVMKRNEEEAKAQAKAIDELFASRDRLFDQAKQNETNANAQLEAIQFETAALTMTNVEREQAIALRELERTGLDKTSEAYKQLAEDIKKAVGDRAALQQQISDFQNVWNSVDRTAQQAFTNIFEGGQDAFTKLRDTLKATLLDLLYQMTVRKWVFNMAANVTGASSGAVGAVANSSGLNSIGGLLGNFSGMSMANTAGSMFANATGGGLDALLATNGAFGTAAGGAGIMGTLSAALPWVGGALAIASMLESPRGGPKTIGGEANAATIQAAVAATLTTFGVSASNFRVGGFSASDPAGDSLTQVQAALFMGDRALYSRQDRVGNYEDVGRSADAEAAAWAKPD